MSLRLVPAGMRLVCALAILPAAVRADVTPVVDERPAIVIGAHAVSGYTLRKYFERFREQHARENGAEPDAADQAAWLRKFIGLQVVIAHAREAGYAEHPEVLDVVQRMERHMLTQPYGPFYQALYRQAALGKGGLGEAERRRLQRQRREKILVRADLRLNPTLAEEAIRAWQRLPEQARDLPAAGDGAGAEVELFRFRSTTGGEAVVGLGDFVRWFNGLFVRRIPRDPSLLRELAEDWVVAEYDLAEARAAGIDREPQFRQDRRGFLDFQVLEVFSAEHLRPGITVTDREIAADYAARRETFRRPDLVRLRAWRFGEPDAAGAWLSAMKQAGGAMIGTRPDEEQTLDLGPDSPPPGLETIHPLLFRLPQDAWFGPVWVGDRVWVFRSEGVVETAIPALAEVADGIRARLERAALETAQQRLARSLRDLYRIGLDFDPAEYGVAPEDLVRE